MVSWCVTLIADIMSFRKIHVVEASGFHSDDVIVDPKIDAVVGLYWYVQSDFIEGQVSNLRRNVSVHIDTCTWVEPSDTDATLGALEEIKNLGKVWQFFS